MSAPIPLYLAVEDELSELVARRLLNERPRAYAVGAVYGKKGVVYLKKQAAGFNNAARYCPFFVLIDLDNSPCAPALLDEWFDQPRHENFLLRIVVREIESWLMGDHEGLAKYLGCRRAMLPPNPEIVDDPKRTLLYSATASRIRRMREAVVWRDPRSGTLHQGPDYNGTLGGFVQKSWDLNAARARCPSLERAWLALADLEKRFS